MNIPEKIKIDTGILKYLKYRDVLSGLGEMSHYYCLSKKNYKIIFLYAQLDLKLKRSRFSTEKLSLQLLVNTLPLFAGTAEEALSAKP